MGTRNPLYLRGFLGSVLSQCSSDCTILSFMMTDRWWCAVLLQSIGDKAKDAAENVKDAVGDAAGAVKSKAGDAKVCIRILSNHLHIVQA